MAFGEQRTARIAPVWREVLLRTQFRKYAVLGVGALVGCVLAGGRDGVLEAMIGTAVGVLGTDVAVRFQRSDVRDLAAYPTPLTPVWYEIALACAVCVAAYVVTRLANQAAADGIAVGSFAVGAGAGFLIGIPLGIARVVSRRPGRRQDVS